MHLHHLTITTGHSRRSWRHEIEPGALRATEDLLASALANGGRVDLPVQPAGHWLRITPYGRCLLATVMHGDELPLVSFGVASRSRYGGDLWRSLLDCDPRVYGPMQGRPDAQPQAPWCAVRLEPGLPLVPSAAAWLDDLERCIAWAWLDKESR